VSKRVPIRLMAAAYLAAAVAVPMATARSTEAMQSSLPIDHPAPSIVDGDERERRYAEHLAIGSHVRGGWAVPNWLADGDRFWYADGEPAGTDQWRAEWDSLYRSTP
jgi:hypothetical protein